MERYVDDWKESVIALVTLIVSSSAPCCMLACLRTFCVRAVEDSVAKMAGIIRRGVRCLPAYLPRAEDRDDSDDMIRSGVMHDWEGGLVPNQLIHQISA